MRPLIIAFFLMFATPAWAQQASSPVGVWQTVDQHTGQPRGLVRIYEAAGLLYGRVVEVFPPGDPRAICSDCSGDRKGKPVVGLEIMRGLHPDGGGHWSGGEILDPETGDTYRVAVQLADGGRKLVVRGSILGGLLGGSQTWARVAWQ